MSTIWDTVQILRLLKACEKHQKFYCIFQISSTSKGDSRITGVLDRPNGYSYHDVKIYT